LVRNVLTRIILWEELKRFSCKGWKVGGQLCVELHEGRGRNADGQSAVRLQPGLKFLQEKKRDNTRDVK
jgi:hypothetical protein